MSQTLDSSWEKMPWESRQEGISLPCVWPIKMVFTGCSKHTQESYSQFRIKRFWITDNIQWMNSALAVRGQHELNDVNLCYYHLCTELFVYNTAQKQCIGSASTLCVFTVYIYVFYFCIWTFCMVYSAGAAHGLYVYLLCVFMYFISLPNFLCSIQRRSSAAAARIGSVWTLFVFTYFICVPTVFV